MYSILLVKNSNGYSYYLNKDNTVYKAETIEAVQDKVKELVQTTPLNKIVVVKNCVIEPTMTVTEETA